MHILEILCVFEILTMLKLLWIQQNTPTPTVPSVITSNGYPCEIHHVTSNEGYILELHRIPYGNRNFNGSGQAVFVQHGLLSSSADWVVSGPDKALAFVLADAGYDVWLGNVRGNKYSRKHVTLDPNKDAKIFWNFSWHEMGIDDLPTMIDYVIDKVKQDQIFYIGHSQGTTVFFVMCSERPKYNGKIKAFFGLAPVAWTANMKSPVIKKIAQNNNIIQPITNLIGMYEFLPSNDFLSLFTTKICTDNSVFHNVCNNALLMIYGMSRNETNSTVLLSAAEHYPAGSSSKQVLHYAQEFNSGHFRQWDYGRKGNRKQYGTAEPPDYNVKNIVAPVYLYYSLNDWLSSEADVKKLYEKISNPKGLYKIYEKEFNHADFIVGVDACELIYNHIIRIMETEYP